MSEIKEELQKTLEDFRERILELNKSERVIDNIKADELKECAITLEKILKGENYYKADYDTPEPINTFEFTDLIVDNIRESLDSIVGDDIELNEDAEKEILNKFKNILSLIDEKGIDYILNNLERLPEDYKKIIKALSERDIRTLE